MGILDSFAEVKIENSSRVPEHLIIFGEAHETTFNLIVDVLENQASLFKKLEVLESEYLNVYVDLEYESKKVNREIEELTEKFIKKVCRKFQDEYRITIDMDKIVKRYKEQLPTFNNIVDEIFAQSGGVSFEEQAVNEIKSDLKKLCKNYVEATVKGNKVQLSNTYIISYCNIFKKYEVSYEGKRRATTLFKALSCYDHNEKESNSFLNQLYLNYPKESDLFEKYELNWKKVNSIKFFKNGRIDIEFSSYTYAKTFLNEYCGIY